MAWHKQAPQRELSYADHVHKAKKGKDKAFYSDHEILYSKGGVRTVKRKTLIMGSSYKEARERL